MTSSSLRRAEFPLTRMGEFRERSVMPDAVTDRPVEERITTLERTEVWDAACRLVFPGTFKPFS